MTLEEAIPKKPDPKVLNELLEYNPMTGALVWRKRSEKWFASKGGVSAQANAERWNKRYANKPALSSLTNYGYLCGALVGFRVLAHRVVFAMHYGEWPKGQIDHINGDRFDNRICNLRDVSRAENAKNSKKPITNTSGVIGVTWNRSRKKWVAQIKVDQKNQFLGHFDCKEDAATARAEAELRFGFHENHGREA